MDIGLESVFAELDNFMKRNLSFILTLLLGLLVTGLTLNATVYVAESSDSYIDLRDVQLGVSVKRDNQYDVAEGIVLYGAFAGELSDVSRVEYFARKVDAPADSEVIAIGSARQAPYKLTWRALRPGEFAITGKVIFENGSNVFSTEDSSISTYYQLRDLDFDVPLDGLKSALNANHPEFSTYVNSLPNSGRVFDLLHRFQRDFPDNRLGVRKHGVPAYEDGSNLELSAPIPVCDVDLTDPGGANLLESEIVIENLRQAFESGEYFLVVEGLDINTYADGAFTWPLDEVDYVIRQGLLSSDDYYLDFNLFESGSNSLFFDRITTYNKPGLAGVQTHQTFAVYRSNKQAVGLVGYGPDNSGGSEAESKAVIDLSDYEKAIFPIHGWQTKGTRNASEKDNFAVLEGELVQQLRNSPEWALVPFNWSEQASTGGKTYFAGTKQDTATGAGTKAAEQGYQRGLMLGHAILDEQPQLKRIHFIVHSAGSWVAFAASRVLVHNDPEMEVQVTLLDAYMPLQARVAYSLLGEEVMNRMDSVGEITQWFFTDHIFSRDILTGSGTQSWFSWKRIPSSMTNLDVDLTDYGFDEFKVSEHGEPIVYYARTIKAVRDGALYVDGDNDEKRQLFLMGWKASMLWSELELLNYRASRSHFLAIGKSEIQFLKNYLNSQVTLVSPPTGYAYDEVNDKLSIDSNFPGTVTLQFNFQMDGNQTNETMDVSLFQLPIEYSEYGNPYTVPNQGTVTEFIGSSSTGIVLSVAEPELGETTQWVYYTGTYVPPGQVQSNAIGGYSLIQSVTYSPLDELLPEGAEILESQTGTILDVSSLVGDVSGSYFVIYTSESGSRRSGTIQLEKEPSIPEIIGDPGDLILRAGDSGELFINANGSPRPNYEWSKDGAILIDELGNRISFQNVGEDEAGEYSVTVYNTQGAVPAGVANLHVIPTDAVAELSPAFLIASQAGGLYPLSVTADSGWVSDESEDWVDVSPQSSTGSGQMDITVSGNNTGNPRYGDINVLDTPVKVIQAASDSHYTVLSWIQDYLKLDQISDYQVTLPDADPDWDGISNELEMLLALDPGDGSSRILSSSELDGNSICIFILPYVGGINYSLEKSSDLVNWESVNYQIDIVEPGLAKLIVPSELNTFYRIRISD
jgi:hypothetical protein